MDLLVLVFHLAAVARPAGLSWKWAWGRGTQSAWLGGSGGASGVRQGREVPLVLSGVAIAAGNAHFLGPHRLASSQRSGGVRATGKGTGTRWSREPRFPPSLLAQSRSPLTWRSRKGLAFGVKAFTALPLRIKLRPLRVFPSTLVPAGSPRDLSCLVVSPAGTS